MIADPVLGERELRSSNASLTKEDGPDGPVGLGYLMSRFNAIE